MSEVAEGIGSVAIPDSVVGLCEKILDLVLEKRTTRQGLKITRYASRVSVVLTSGIEAWV